MRKAIAMMVLTGCCLLAAQARAQTLGPNSTGMIWRDALEVDSENELDRLNRALTRLASAVRPAIVQVRVARLPEDKPEGDSTPGQSRGSGFLIDPAGYLLTAHHVIDKAKDIEVRLADGQRLAAKIVAADERVDVAILRVESNDPLPVVPLGDSGKIRVGDLAIVFGYPFGRESSMNMGIVSRPGRSFPDSASFEFIQTDAGAYAGGSGGPLLNRGGHVIGMITMASERGNMGFATPINAIKWLIPRIIKGEQMVWGWLGVQTAELSVERAKVLGLSPIKGVLVHAVLSDQPAERGGLLKQDIILSVNDAEVSSPRDVSRLIGGLEAGRLVKLTILRDGKILQLSMPLGRKPESAKGRES